MTKSRDGANALQVPNAPSLFRSEPDQVGETADVHFDYSQLKLPRVTDAIAMSARGPLSTVLHYDVAVRVLLAWVNDLRMCLHCPECSEDNLSNNERCNQRGICLFT